jgi:transcriptional regulator with XRE-family HTH domain
VAYVSSFGERLAALRKKKGLSQAGLGRLLKVGQSTIAMYEKNRRSPDYKLLKRLADFFEVTTDYLLGRTDRPSDVPHNEALQVAAFDPLFVDLLKQASQLTEEEKQLLVKHWKQALRLVIQKKGDGKQRGGSHWTSGKIEC